MIQEILTLRSFIYYFSFTKVNAEMEKMDYTEDDDEEGGSNVSKNNQKANKLQIGRF